MKHFIATSIFLLIAFNAISQQCKYGSLSKGNYTEYISKSGKVIHVGDTIQLGKPSGEFGFVFITQGNQRVISALAGKNAVITQLKSVGTNKSGFKMYAAFKGYGLLPVYIDYEMALETCEIKIPAIEGNK